MYRTILVFLLTFTFFQLSSQVIDIPDNKLKEALFDNGIDINDDNEIQQSEAELSDSLDLAYYDIIDLTGIEFFVNLKYLDCGHNELNELDISALSSLETLWCDHNYTFNEVDFSKNLKLKRLFIFNNELENLDLSNNQELQIIDCSLNNISGTIDLSQNLELVNVDIARNSISNVILGNNTKVTSFCCAINRLEFLDITALPNLKDLDCSYNDLQSLNLSELDSLYSLRFTGNEVEEIDIRNSQILRFLNISDNRISSIDLAQNTNLEILNCKENLLTKLELGSNTSLRNLYCTENNINEIILSSNPYLSYLYCEDNAIESLDLSSCGSLVYLNIENNNLTNLNIKNNSLEGAIILNGNDNLEYLCCDDEQVEGMVQLVEELQLSSLINSYCSENGGINTISGSVLYGTDFINCQTTETQIPHYKLNAESDILQGVVFSNLNGDFDLKINEETIIISPEVNTSYFNASPETREFEFDASTTDISQDFCIYPNAVIQDLELTIVPLSVARPGFESRYKIIYKNIGTTVTSGDIRLEYQSELIDLVNASSELTINTGDLLGWEYFDLFPFESREIIVGFLLNSPMDAPSLNLGDMLTFNAQILPIESDNVVTNNSMCLKQEVVNAYDPNDKKCLEGESINQDMVGNYIHYMIRFENNGNSNAVNISVIDTLDIEYFDINTLEVVDSSHDLDLILKNNNIAHFYFSNINLSYEDENNDGYIIFRIRTLSTLGGKYIYWRTGVVARKHSIKKLFSACIS